jgi:hypothetical protein
MQSERRRQLAGPVLVIGFGVVALASAAWNIAELRQIKDVSFEWGGVAVKALVGSLSLWTGIVLLRQAIKR